MSDKAHETRSYLVGTGLSLILTAIAFAVVLVDSDRSVAIVVIGFAAVLQIMVQLRCFLHIGFSRQQREDMQLILFSLLLLAIMAGGTIWILENLSSRMM